MSIKVMTWVWDHSPTKGTELLMLLAIADNASDDGSNAYPSIRTLANKTRLDSRTVQRIIRKLVDQDQLLVEERGGRHSNRYTVLMRELSTAPADCHPRQNATGGIGATPGAAELRHPTPGTATPPEPPGTVLEPSTTAEPAAVRAVEAEEELIQDIDTVLDSLGPAWPLTPKQRQRLAPKMVQALASGWSTQRLAEHLAANPSGVKSAVAVLAARLDDLPTPVRTSVPLHRPDWCGACDEPSRMVETADGRWTRCPACHPAQIASPAAEMNPERPKPPSTHRSGSSTPTSHETGGRTTSVPRTA